MLLSEIITQTRNNFAYDADLVESFGNTTSPTDAQIIPFINWAIRSIARRTKQIKAYIPITLVADQNTYNLNGGGLVAAALANQITKIHRVYINNSVMNKPDGRTAGMWAYNEIERYNPNYRTATSGQPVAAAQFGNNLILYPAPSSTVASGTGNFCVAEYLPTDLTISDLANSPDLPNELHEAVAYLAAIRISTPQITEDESYKRLATYTGYINETIETVKKQNEASIFDFGSTFAYNRPRYIRWS